MNIPKINNEELLQALDTMMYIGVDTIFYMKVRSFMSQIEEMAAEGDQRAEEAIDCLTKTGDLLKRIKGN
jgi:hypothetical protein